ncbi:amidase [Cyclobacterium plantarum]|uniref:amidase n=1 Tax=Cyclobacterium plantarum TaxID=2716263 RepID=UPI003F711229
MIFKKKNSRRDFISSSFMLFGKGGLGLMAPPVFSAANSINSSHFYQSNYHSQDVKSASVVQMAQMIRDKEISSVELVNIMYSRIEEVNPQINAVVLTCKERALMEAQKADEMLGKGDLMGALHGVPMTIKDSLDTAGVLSTGGTLGRKDHIPSQDATIVARLRSQGAILLGKTNTPEFTLSGTTANLIYGMTSNPYKEGYSPGGSSGGAAAIVATGGSPFDIGSDFGGSIRGPAHFNGIAGMKPTTGLVPRTGHIVDYGGLFDAYQVLGPMARYVEDLKLILPIIMGPDQIDAAIHPVPWTDPDTVQIKDLKYAWFVAHGSTKDCSMETVAAITRAVASLETAGIQVKEDAPIKDFQEAEEVRYQLSSADGRAWVGRLTEKYGTKQTHPLLRLPDPSTAIPSVDFTEMVEKLDACRSKLLQWMHNYDIVICPVHFDGAAPNPTVFERSSRSADDYGYMGIFNLTGWPAAVVRAGTSKEGLPIGVQIVGQPFQDHKVLAVAQFLEKELGGWQAPPI